MNFLMRDQAPLSPQQWQVLDDTVVRVARAALVGRRFVSIFGPLGAGVQAVPDDRLSGGDHATVDLLGDAQDAGVRLSVRRYLPIPQLYKDFVVPWRDLELSAHLRTALDPGEAAAAAAAVAHTEDELIFNGSEALGLPGLRTVEGAHHQPLGDWNDANQAFGDVVQATETLINEHFFGPFTLVAGPLLYAQLNRMFGNAGVLTIEHVEKLLRGGVYQSSALPEGTALVVAAGAQNLDLALALDLSVGYEGPVGLNHSFRVIESLVPRIKRPGAIVVLSRAAAAAGRAGRAS